MGKHVVLVVDDDNGAKNVARDILELCGHRVLTAGTRGDALLLCDLWGTEINTVVLDTSRPEPISSSAVIDKIREINPAAKLIVTSIYGTDQAPETVGAASAAGFLKKPYRMTELVCMLDKLHEQ